MISSGIPVWIAIQYVPAVNGTFDAVVVREAGGIGQQGVCCLHRRHHDARYEGEHA
jgi:hypothetical protein